MWNLKNNTNESLYNTETDTENKSMVTERERERERGKDRLGVWDSQIKN